MNREELINKAMSGNASDFNHFLKDYGNGSMKRGFIKILDRDELLEKNNKRNSIIIGGISSGLILMIAMNVYHCFKNRKIEDKDNIDIQELKKTVEKIPDDEFEEIVKGSFDDQMVKEGGNNDAKV